MRCTGGTRDQESLVPAEPAQEVGSDAQDTLRSVHVKTGPGTSLKEYKIRQLTELAGTSYKNRSGRPTKWDSFCELCRKFPFYFKLNADGTSVRRLDLDLIKFESIVEKHGVTKFGGGYQAWGLVWEHETRLPPTVYVAHDHTTPVSPTETESDNIVEVVHLQGLRDHLASGVDRRPDAIRAYVERIEKEGVIEGALPRSALPTVGNTA